MKKTLLPILPVSLCFIIFSKSFGQGDGANSKAVSVANNTREPAWVSNSKEKNAGASTKGKTGESAWAWTVQPFDHKVFIENRGQFDTLTNDHSKVIFGAQLGDNLFAYFTTTGIVYRSIVFPKLAEAEKEAKESKDDPDKKPVKPIISYLNMQWEGSNPNVSFEAKEERTDYYTYPTGPKSSVQVNLFKRFIYHNLYPGIDAEYTFIKDKQGFKYSLIVHPGADLSVVKLNYKGASGMSLNSNGDIIIKNSNGVGDIIDHAPVSIYQGGGNVKSSYTLNGKEESFNADASYDKSKTLVIDPWTWTSSPGLATNKAYDLDYDKAGNIYVYGSSSTWQLAKFTSGGVPLWTYNATLLATGYYGDFACDKLSGKCFCTEGFNASGMDAVEVSTAGAQLATTKTVANLQEGWRDAWNPCNCQIVIGGGSWQTVCDAGGYMDTNLNVTPVNVLNENATEEGHDMALTCVDPNGTQCYMATTQSAGDPTNFNNQIISLPTATLSPAAYFAPTGYAFQESNVAQYVGSFTANGLNGMAASPNWLYIYDGANLKRVNKGTGAIVSTVVITGTPEDWGGLDVDNCDNLYVGENSAVQVYNSSLALTTTYATSNTVYDVVLGTNFQTLYACGNGFLSSMPLPAPSYTINKTRTNASCGCTGAASAELVACGTPVVAGVTYAWSSGQTTSSISALCAGTYTITITQAGCPKNVYTDTVLIKSTVGGGGIILTMSSTPSACAASTGTATVTVTGGTSPYTYLWNSGQSTSSISPLSSGTYCVTVTDKNGCKDSSCVVVANAGGLTATINIIKNVSCFGASNGSADGVIVGGTGPFTYNWSNAQTTDTATGLAIGSYTLSVTDVNGCKTSAIVTITQPTQIRDSITIITNPLCSTGGTGSATVGVTGGTGKYTYSWNSFPVQTNAKASNLSGGSYTVTVTDSNGCSNTAVATLVAPAPITITTSTVPSACVGNSGSATATPAGGTGSYTYNWNPTAQTTPTATSLSSGTYTVTVTDANGCQGTATAIVGNVGGETDTIVDVVNVKCFNGKTGSATDSAIGGTPAYTYTWSNGQTNATATGLSAGSYTVTTKDSRGCIATAIIVITQPSQLRDSITKTRGVACAGMTNGSATVGVKGGTGPYTFTWAPSGGTADSGVGIGIGTYTVTVKDANGCTVSASATITAPPAIKIIAAAFPTTCNDGIDGSATVIPSGGNPPFTYQWSNGATNANTDDLIAGTYTITVTDSHGCSHDTSVTVTQPPALLVGFDSDTLHGCGPLCVNFDDMSTDPIPGDTIKHWSWDYGDGNKDTIENPRHCYTNPGTYSVRLTVTSKRGCSNSLTIANMITVYNNPVPDFSVSPQPTTIFQPNIQFTDKSTDAYGIVSWLWTFNDAINDTATVQDPMHTYGDTGIYCPMLTVTNIHGCKDSITHCLIISPQYTLYIPDAFTPNGDTRDDIFLPKGEYIATYDMYIFDRWGMKIFHSNDITKGWNGGVDGGTRICQEDTYVYLIDITDNLGKKHSYLGRVTLLK